MSVVRRRMSFTELQQSPDDGRRYELYDGELVVVPAPIPLHQRVVFRIAELLHDYERTHGGFAALSPLDIVFDEHTVLQPDVVFIVESRRHLFDLEHAIRIAPDLAVEVLSPSTSDRDRGRKMEIYAREGVREYWLIDPKAHTIEVYRPESDAWALAQRGAPGEFVESLALPGLRFDAGRIFIV